MTVAFGELGELVIFPVAALAWLAGQGVVHFVLGRYCNYESNQLMGVNLAAPVVQLQVPFAMMLAVAILHEKFTVLQVVGSVLMLGGSFVTQTRSGKRRNKRLPPLMPAMLIARRSSEREPAVPGPSPKPAFRPRVVSGYFFGLGAAICWQLAINGARGLSERARRRHRGRGLRRLCGGDTVLLADPT